MEKNPSKSSSSSKPDRKTIEKKRRDQMRNLFTELNSLLPNPEGSTSRENMSLPEQIEESTKYIKKLKAHVERLKEKQSSLAGNNHHRSCAESSDSRVSPQIEVRVVRDSALQVVLITGLDCQFIFTEALRILHDEGAEVVNASFTVMDDHTTVYHTIHAKVNQIEECSQRQVAIGRITERLNRFCS